VVICLERGADCLHMVQPMPVPSPSFLASFKSRLVLPFLYQLTQVVLEKRPLNGCSNNSISSSSSNVPIIYVHLHVLRKEDDDWVKKCMECEVEGPRPRGRPKRIWREVVTRGLSGT